jgi:hypothetical protein
MTFVNGRPKYIIYQVEIKNIIKIAYMHIIKY